MKRLISIVALLLFLGAGLWGGVTYWFGVKAEEQYRAFLEQASPWQYVKLANESYTRGFWGAKARTIVALQQPPGATAENQGTQFILAHDITHGPFPLVASPDGKRHFKPVMAIIETRLVTGPETQSFLAELTAQIPELASVRDYTVINLDGGGEEQLLIPPFQRTLGTEDQVAVDWQGLSSQFKFPADLKGFSGSLSVPGLNAVANDFSLKIKEVKSAFNSYDGVSGLSLGEASFDLGGLEWVEKQENEPYALLIRGFSANTSSTPSGDNISGLVAMRIEQWQFDTMTYGPGVFEMAFRNFDAASLVKIGDAVREFQTQASQQSAEAAQLMMLVRLTDALPDVLKKSPEVEITQLDLKTADGDFTGKSKIAFDGTKLESALNLVALADGLTAQAEFRVGERLLRHVASNILKDRLITKSEDEEQETPTDEELDAMASATVDDQLKALVAQNLLVKENGNYRANASYKAGQLVLNGRPLSLQDLMQ